MMFYKRTDLIIVLSIVIFSIVFGFVYHFYFSGKPAKAEIYYNSKLVKTVKLNEGVDKIFSIEQNENVVFHLFADGKICFEKSNCPDKVCINSGKMGIVGESAACLPNGIVLKIVPEKNHSEEDADIIAGR